MSNSLYTNGGPPRVAYLTNTYPSVSHTFIRREIEGLEALGYEIMRLAIRPSAAVVDPADEAEAKKTYHLLADPPLSLMIRAAAQLAKRPVAALAALAMTLQMHRASERGLIRHLAYLMEAAVLLPRVRRGRIDHIHVHFGTIAAAVVRLMRRLGGPPYSMTIHGPDEFDAPIGLSLGAKMQDAAFTVAISNFGASQLRRWVPYTEWAKIKIVHCTVSERWFDDAPPVAEEAADLVCVGRLSGQKGQLLLLEAFAEVARKKDNARLVLVGDGEMRAIVEERIAALDLQDRAVITGWQDESAVRGHLERARALVLGSFAEGLPVVLMEAMALRRPVVATYIAGIPELVRPGENGWLTPAGEASALAKAMLEVLETPAERLNQMAAEGQQSVRDRHTRETEAAKLDALFRRQNMV